MNRFTIQSARSGPLEIQIRQKVNEDRIMHDSMRETHFRTMTSLPFLLTFLLFCSSIKIFQKGNGIKIAGRRVFGIFEEFWKEKRTRSFFPQFSRVASDSRLSSNLKVYMRIPRELKSSTVAHDSCRLSVKLKLS